MPETPTCQFDVRDGEGFLRLEGDWTVHTLDQVEPAVSALDVRGLNNLHACQPVQFSMCSGFLFVCVVTFFLLCALVSIL